MSERILIVDDDPEVCTLCTDALADEDYQVETSDNGETAYELAQRQPFDVVLSDIRMPGMTGLELLENLKNLDPDQPVIMISGFADADAAVQAMKLGAFDSLAKPLVVDELKVIIAKALRQNRLRQENEKLRQELNGSHVAMANLPKMIPLLQNMSTEAAREFYELGQIDKLHPQDVLLEEGLLDNRLYVILDGELSVWQDQAQMYRLGRGECYGEINIFRQGLRSQGLVAELASHVLFIDKDALLGFFNKKEERVFKLFVFNALNAIYAKNRKACARIASLERSLKG